LFSHDLIRLIHISLLVHLLLIINRNFNVLRRSINILLRRYNLLFRYILIVDHNLVAVLKRDSLVTTLATNASPDKGKGSSDQHTNQVGDHADENANEKRNNHLEQKASDLVQLRVMHVLVHVMAMRLAVVVGLAMVMRMRSLVLLGMLALVTLVWTRIRGQRRYQAISLEDGDEIVVYDEDVSEKEVVPAEQYVDAPPQYIEVPVDDEKEVNKE